MQPNTKKVLIGIAIALAAVALLLAAYLIGRSTGGESSVAKTGTTAPATITAARTATEPQRVETVTVQAPAPTTPAPAPEPALGPYATMAAASSHVASQEGGMQLLDPVTTWNPGGTLHVIRATPEGSASYGGDFFYFFVDGYQVGLQIFTSASAANIVDGATFAVTFNVYLSTDPHCCPSGGLKTVQFYWDGGSLVTIGDMTGATL